MHTFTNDGELTLSGGQTWTGHIFLSLFGINAGLSLNMSYDPPRLSMSGCDTPTEIGYAISKSCFGVNLVFDMGLNDCCNSNGKGSVLIVITE